MICGQAVRELLEQQHGQLEWIEQVSEAVRIAVHNGVTQFGGRQVVQANAQPDDQYRFAPRNREELIRDAALVADSRTIGEAEEPAVPKPQTQAAPDARTERRHDTGPVSWLL